MCTMMLLQDYLFQYRAGIEAVTPQDVLAAARRSCATSQLLFVSCLAVAVAHIWRFAMPTWDSTVELSMSCTLPVSPSDSGTMDNVTLMRWRSSCRHLHPAQQTVVIIADVEASGVKAKLEKQGRKVVPLRLEEEEAVIPSFSTAAAAAHG